MQFAPGHVPKLLHAPGFVRNREMVRIALRQEPSMRDMPARERRAAIKRAVVKTFGGKP